MEVSEEVFRVYRTMWRLPTCFPPGLPRKAWVPVERMGGWRGAIASEFHPHHLFLLLLVERGIGVGRFAEVDA